MKPVEWTREAFEAFRPSVAASPWGLEGLADVLTGAFLYQFEAGSRSALVAARPVYVEGGTRLDLVGLVSIGDRLRIEEFGPEFEQIARAHGANEVAMCTKWPHVVRSCRRGGWAVTGTVMSKKIHEQ